MIGSEWAPEPCETTDVISEAPVRALAGLLDQQTPDRELPVLWHWLFFLDRPRQSELGPDGHPAEGRFLPPLPDRRRMFAGARFTSHRPIELGDELTRRSELVSARAKSGRTGELLFTTLRHEFRRDGELVATEEQDIVYRSGDPSGVAAAPPAVDAAGEWELGVTPDPVLLFRFSALTYNAHRIHYDHAYATEVEGHQGLVVHGPLLAILLAELPRRHGSAVTGLEFRAKAPCFAGQRLDVVGGPDSAAVIRPDRAAAMTMSFFR